MGCVIIFGPVSDLFVRSELYCLSLESNEEIGITVTLKVNVASNSNEQNPSWSDRNVLLYTLDVLLLSIIISMLCAKNRVLILWQHIQQIQFALQVTPLQPQTVKLYISSAVYYILFLLKNCCLASSHHSQKKGTKVVWSSTFSKGESLYLIYP